MAEDVPGTDSGGTGGPEPASGKRKVGLYENAESWESSVPADLIPALEHLRDSFDRAHFGFGRTLERFCYSVLHDTPVDDPEQEYFKYFLHTKQTVGPAATSRFNDLVKQGTPSAVFKAFFDLYLGSLTIPALVVFRELVEIGRAKQKRLGTPYVEWAQAQTEQLIRSHRHVIQNWVREVCDKQLYDPNEDWEERIFWRKWQAPMFLVMRPVGPNVSYDPAKAWDRNDAPTSIDWLEHFADDYVLRLEIRLRKAAGFAALEAAKVPESAEPEVPSTSPQVAETPVAAAAAPVSPRREVRKLETKKRHKRWQRAYRDWKRQRPEMSDLWYSQQIAKSDIAEGHSAETIRKHMTR